MHWGLTPMTPDDPIEAVFDNEKTTDDLLDDLARLAAGMNPVVRDIRRVIRNQEE